MAFGTKKTRVGSEGAADQAGAWKGERWAYATVTAQTNSEALPDRANAMGAAVWNAVGMTAVGMMTQVLLKRRLE